ncbi:MAG: hypothetical protein J0H69_12010 [Burkholderiales bacterium]|jgi:hypothetical protein|nr:hypothetical protein [Burkholderiales bacterium]
MIGRIHARRLREIYRSAGWPSHDPVEIELLAAGLLERVQHGAHETLRVTDAGVRLLADTLGTNRAARSAHEDLVERVAREMTRAGRIAWRGLSLRARVPDALALSAEQTDALGIECEPLTAGASEGPATRWCMAMPDVFSIRNTTVERYVEPVVHEIKVRRADLLSDLRNPAKRAAYLDMASECWYVLGCDARGRPIGAADEIPPECGVMLAQDGRLDIARQAPRRAMTLPFGVWMALARATPIRAGDEETQGLLGPAD